MKKTQILRFFVLSENEYLRTIALAKLSYLAQIRKIKNSEFLRNVYVKTE